MNRFTQVSCALSVGLTATTLALVSQAGVASAAVQQGPASSAVVQQSSAAPAVSAGAGLEPAFRAPSKATQAMYRLVAAPGLNSELDRQLKRLPGGVRISPKALAYDEGNIVYSAGENDINDCPSGAFTTNYTCLFELSYHGGRMLKFKDAGYTQSLVNFDFSNQTSSWANTRGDRAFMHNYPDGGGFTICMPGNSNSVTMGTYDNRVSSIYLAQTNNPC